MRNFEFRECCTPNLSCDSLLQTESILRIERLSDRTHPHGDPRVCADAPWSVAQGPGRRIAWCAEDDENHQPQEPIAQPTRGAFHRQHEGVRETTGETQVIAVHVRFWPKADIRP